MPDDKKIANPFDSCVPVKIAQHRFGVNRKVKNGEASAVSASGEAVSSEAVALTKRLLKSDAYDAIVKLDNAVRKTLGESSVPSPLGEAVYLVPVGLFERIETNLTTYRTERQTAVDTFMSSYADAVSTARTTLGTLFDPSQYPDAEEVERRFSIEIDFIQFGVSNNLERANKDLWEREKDRLQASMRNAAEEIRATLRAGLASLVSHLVERLTGTRDDGKPKIFKDSAVNNISQWLDLFSARDVTNDEELTALVTKCRDVLSGVDPEALRKSAKIREGTTADLNTIKAALDTMLIDAPVRKFSFAQDNDTDAAA